MDQKPKIRLGSGKKRSATWMTASICSSDAKVHEYTYNGKQYFNININIYDTPNQYGKDVAITLNDYEKDGAVPKANAFDTAPVDNLPF
jgi:hypothetical protein